MTLKYFITSGVKEDFFSLKSSRSPICAIVLTFFSKLALVTFSYHLLCYVIVFEGLVLVLYGLLTKYQLPLTLMI